MPRRYSHIIEGDIEKKRCSKCETYKPLYEFSKYIKTWDKLSCRCKLCDRKVRKEIQDVDLQQKSTCLICNKEQNIINFNKNCLEICICCIDELKLKGEKFCYKCKTSKPLDEYGKSNTKQNGHQPHCKKCKSDYKKSIRPTINKQIKEKRQIDVNFKIRKNLGTRIWSAIKSNSKSDFTMELIGCSVIELKDYLEQKFEEGMTWDNYGEWHIDHYLPCAEFDLSKEYEQKACFYYRNLQPMWAKENLSKSSYINYNNPETIKFIEELFAKFYTSKILSEVVG